MNSKLNIQNKENHETFAGNNSNQELLQNLVQDFILSQFKEEKLNVDPKLEMVVEHILNGE